jgi:hypothetical protein
MNQARSRLNRNLTSHQESKRASRKDRKFPSSIKKYINLIPTLTTAMFAYFLLWLMMNSIHPTKIQSWLFPNSYLPFHILFGLANFFLFSFLFQRKIWGFFFSIIIGWLLFLKLQQINIDFWGLTSAISLSIVASFWWIIIKFISKKN